MRIKSIEDILPVIDDIQRNLGLNGRQDFIENYRGQSLDTYKLVNGFSRFNHKPNNLMTKERKLFDKYVSQVKNHKIDFIQEPYHQQQYEFIREWFFLYQAQHLGLKTRLMDWTMRWEIALLFAVNEERHHRKDGQFWIFICPRKYNINSGNLDDIYNKHPLEIDKNYMINSPFYQDIEEGEYIGEKRRTRQHGRFFIQPFFKGLVPMEEQPELKLYLHKYIIDGNSKKRIREELGNITSEWAYYRHDDNVSLKIKYLNDLVIKKCRVK